MNCNGIGIEAKGEEYIIVVFRKTTPCMHEKTPVFELRQLFSKNYLHTLPLRLTQRKRIPASSSLELSEIELSLVVF